ncbi:ectoine/hydroxyectoine ABC transporter permease subunit EhuC [Amycolatopsis antarctica]|uniref:Ectoine/hydroxyectoine ABC transporter permease subunit EhuC n=1 Tax=Amycolatopsis antarctica TaxID=1854586 RepID=A0A263D8Y1_9PSEU|nr:ectoine/hydroxyectoine ABC transporter permease subunit EhuC [Amycolatopsis antarctica]OZM73845.1 ectoine/hydroxyectoine ABC transporter permease subunit EhuC [Amycolatopsis antarctica]
MFDNLSILFPRILDGVPYTVIATVGGIALTIVLSFAAGLGLLASSPVARGLTRVYVEGFRGTSEVVQLFWIYFALPILVGIDLIPLAAGIIVLGLNHGAYGAEIVRGAIGSVPRAQYEGAIALNLTPAQRMWRVILPQAVVEMLPSFNNLFIQLLKSTALLYFIEVTEIFKQGDILRPQYGDDQELIYLIELVFYLLLAIAITMPMRWLERVAARRVGRSVPSRERALAKVTGGAV